jgi:hypothetical protein
MSLYRFGIIGNTAPQNRPNNDPSSSFWKSLRKTGVDSSLNVWQNSQVKFI